MTFEGVRECDCSFSMSVPVSPSVPSSETTTASQMQHSQSETGGEGRERGGGGGGRGKDGLVVKLKMRKGRWSQPLLLLSIFHSCCYPHLSEHYSLKCHNSWLTVAYPGFSIKPAANPLACFQLRGQIPSSGLSKHCLPCIKT